MHTPQNTPLMCLHWTTEGWGGVKLKRG